jgi:hypothetical protein
MNPRIPEGLQTETTPEGEQTLVPGVRPITQRERLETLMCAPLTAQRALSMPRSRRAREARGLDGVAMVRPARADRRARHNAKADQ